MNTGETFFWETTKAKGYKLRPKYHIFICRTDSSNNVFLFISKDGRDGDYKITKPPYSFLLLPESFISCSSVVRYTDAQLKTASPLPEGSLSKEHLLELFFQIANSFTMEAGHIKLVCEALSAVCA